MIIFTNFLAFLFLDDILYIESSGRPELVPEATERLGGRDEKDYKHKRNYNSNRRRMVF